MRTVVIALGLLFGSLTVAGASAAGERAPSHSRHMQQSVGVNMSVSDPMRALAKAEQVVTRVGGHVTNSSGSPSSASLTAQIPPSKLRVVMAEIHRLRGVTNVNRQSSDQTVNVRQNQNRLADLKLAEAALADSLAHATGDSRRGLTVLFELIHREQRTIENSLVSSEVQTTTANLRVSISKRN